MFYRRKILLALLGLLGKKAEKTRLHTLLLLFTRSQEEPVYEFIPDAEGAYSLSAEADLSVMERKAMVRQTGTTVMNVDSADYLPELKAEDRELLRRTVKEYGKLDRDELLRRAFVLYPYYASRSPRASRLLSKKELAHVRAQLPQPDTDTIVLFTIGYEGIALEEYLNRLLRNGVQAIVDIRNHPVSMKYGFSRSTLRRFCERIGVAYIHMPEVGIKPEDRQDLHTQEDYEHLFRLYRKKYLPSTIAAQRRMLELLEQYKRIALACVEAELNRCHRTLLAEALQGFPEFVYEVKHL